MDVTVDKTTIKIFCPALGGVANIISFSSIRYSRLGSLTTPPRETIRVNGFSGKNATPP